MLLYLIRAVKYLLFLMVIFGLFYTVFSFMKTVNIGDIVTYMTSKEGYHIPLLLLFLTFTYPALSFTTKRIPYTDIQKEEFAAKVDSMMIADGFRREDVVMNSDTNSIKRSYVKVLSTVRLRYLFEDKIEIEITNDEIIVKGLRKLIVLLRIKLTYLR